MSFKKTSNYLGIFNRNMRDVESRDIKIEWEGKRKEEIEKKKRIEIEKEEIRSYLSKIEDLDLMIGYLLDERYREIAKEFIVLKRDR